MAISRSTNPLDWLLVDRVSVAEVSPPGAITGAGFNYVGFVVGIFERGPVDQVTLVTSQQDFRDKFGGYGDGSNDGYNAVVGKTWGNQLYVVRISNGTQDTSAVTLQDEASTPVDSVDVTAKNPGAWGDRLRVQAFEPTDSSLSNGFALQVKLLEDDLTTVEAQEYFDNIVDIDSLPADTASKYVNFAKASGATARPDPTDGEQSLTGGDDGTFADSDYVGAVGDVRGLFVLRSRTELGIVVAGSVSDTVNAGVKATVNDAQNMIGVVASGTDADVSTVITDVVDNRDTGGRIVHAYPRVQKLLGGVNQFVPAHSDIAAALTRLAPHRDIAGALNASLFSEITALSQSLTEGDYEVLNANGVLGLEQSDIHGIKVRNGVNTSLDSAKLTISRRRMTDYLTKVIANRLEFWLGRVNKQSNRIVLKGEIESFLEQLVRLEQIDDFLVDVESLNSESSLANGELHIKLQVKLFASMRFIILHAEVGERVVVDAV